MTVSGVLKTVFTVAVVGLGAEIAWQMFLDPLFMSVLHDATNPVATAFIHRMNDLFGWIPRHAGLAKDPGLLSPVMEWFLGDHLAQAKAALDPTALASKVSSQLLPAVPTLDLKM